MAIERVEDRDGKWLRQSFMVPRQRTSIIDQRKQMFGETRFKFTDTTLGGNFAINPPPQRCRYADLRVSGRNINNQNHDGKGMGRYYSEAIDDNSQLINMRFGVPEFNSLTTFFTSFYNSEASLLARTGRSSPAAYTAGRALGFVATIPFAPIIFVFSGLRFLANMPASKFYYLKPTMPLYWNAVNTIVNNIAVDMGIIPAVWGDDQKKVVDAAANKGESVEGILPTASDITAMSRLFADLAPDIFDKKGGIDIYAVANKATRLSIVHQDKIRKIMETATSADDLASKLNSYIDEPIADPGTAPGEGETAIDSMLRRWTKYSAGNVTAPANPDEQKYSESLNNLTESTSRGMFREAGSVDTIIGAAADLLNFYEAERRDGSDWVTFRVNNTGSTTESFSNTTRDSDIQNKINSTSAAAREAKLNFANGNIGDGLAAQALEGAVGALRDFGTGLLDSVHMSGLLSLAGAAFVDMPQHWESAAASLPSSSYTINLRTPYGNKLAIYQNLMVPLAMLLAGVLPLSTGRHSYTSPFLVELYSQGRSQVRLGIIDSMSITRGVGNLGWSVDQLPLGIDITFSVKDLSSIMHMPIEPNFSLNPAKGVFDDDNSFNDYLAVLSGMSLSDQIYSWDHKLKLALTRKAVSFRQWTSPARWANWANGTLPGRLVNAMSRQVDRPSP